MPEMGSCNQKLVRSLSLGRLEDRNIIATTSSPNFEGIYAVYVRDFVDTGRNL